MKCKECRSKLFAYADRALQASRFRRRSEMLPAKLPAEIEGHLAECSSCTALAAALRLCFSETRFSESIPDATVERVSSVVMSRIRAAEDGSSLDANADSRSKADRFNRPRKPVFHRAAALAAAAILLVVSSVGLTLMFTERGTPGDSAVAQPANESGSRTSDRSKIKVHFSIEAPHAESVAVVGDWNGWDPQAQPMQDEDGDGVWELQIRLDKSGEYKYQFLINGEKWVPDPNAPLKVNDGFGGTNSVLDI